jgi:ribose 5-phosphate isomerase A
MATQRIVRQFQALGGDGHGAPEGRPAAGDRQRPAHPGRDRPAIRRPLAFETEVNSGRRGDVGVFAQQKAAVCLLGTSGGVQTLNY